MSRYGTGSLTLQGIAIGIFLPARWLLGLMIGASVAVAVPFRFSPQFATSGQNKRSSVFDTWTKSSSTVVQQVVSSSLHCNHLPGNPPFPFDSCLHLNFLQLSPGLTAAPRKSVRSCITFQQNRQGYHPGVLYSRLSCGPADLSID
jgi:hypothetical protein